MSAVLSGLLHTPARFALPLACALLWAGVTIAGEHNLGPFAGDDLVERLQILLFLGFFWTLATRLFAEGKAWPMAWYLALSLAGLGLLALDILTGPRFGDPIDEPTLVFLAPALVLAMIAAPFGLRAGQDGAFWDFNRGGWLGAAFGLLAAVILHLGLLAAYAALEELFGIEVSYRVFEDTMILCYAVVWPWLALTATPRSFETPAGNPCPRWLGYVIGYLLVPLVLLYLAIVYAYLAKILVQWDLPKGRVGILVSAYAAFGVATHILAHPLRESGTRLVRLYHRHFYHALFAPIALLAVAVGVRVADYGVTEARYALVVLAAWLTALALLFTLRPETRLTVVPLSLAGLLVLASFGPWGAASVALHSQLARLEGLPEANGLLATGRIVQGTGAIDFDQQKRISAQIDYLWATGRRERLGAWFAEAGGAFDGTADKEAAMAVLGLDYVAEWEDRASFVYSVGRPDALDVSGFEVLGTNMMSDPELQELRTATAGRRYLLVFDDDNDRLTARGPEGDVVVFDLAALAERLREGYQDYDDEGTRDLMTLQDQKGNLRVRLLVESIHGNEGEGARDVTYFDYNVLLGPATGAP